MKELNLGTTEHSGPLLLDQVNLVLFDCDNILVDSASSATDELKKRLRKIVGPGIDLNFGHNDIKGWDQLTRWAQESGLGYEEARKLEWAIWTDQRVMSGARPVNGAIELVRQLRAKSIRLSLFTSRPVDQKSMTETWMKENLGKDLDMPILIRVDEVLSGEEHKAQVAVLAAQEHGTVLFVEDSPGHAAKILASTQGLNVYGILVPYGDIELPEDLVCDPRLKIIPRVPWTRGLCGVHEYLGLKTTWSHNLIDISQDSK